MCLPSRGTFMGCFAAKSLKNPVCISVVLSMDVLTLHSRALSRRQTFHNRISQLFLIKRYTYIIQSVFTVYFAFVLGRFHLIDIFCTHLAMSFGHHLLFTMWTISERKYFAQVRLSSALPLVPSPLLIRQCCCFADFMIRSL